MQTRKMYNILTQAIFDEPFRNSLFQGDRQVLEEADLSTAEHAYLSKLPYEAFEKMVGKLITHWLIPMTVNDRYLILPESTRDIPGNDFTPIRLTKSLVFGNGTHATSALCLAALDEYLLPGMSVLDLGTGSGILSIAAARQGAGKVLAFDIDPTSVETAKINIDLNSVEAIVTARQGSLAEAQEVGSEMSGFDLVLVNILTPVVRSFLEAGLSQVLKPGAILITSGIKLNEVSIIERSASKAGLTNPIVKNMEGWAVVVSRKASPPNQRK